MSHRLFCFSLIFSILLLSSSARSQEAAQVRVSEERAELKKKATELLVSVAGQITTLRSAENRARIGSNAAEALWEADEKRARALFAAVGEDIRTGFADSDPDLERHNHTLLVFWQLRSDTLGRIAKHDPELALEFLRATRLSADLHPYQTADSENSQELRLAGQVAAKNPDLALKLGRESLAQGFSQELLVMLSTLQSRNKEVSLNFYQEIVDKLRTADMVQEPAAIYFGFRLAQEFQPPQIDEKVYREVIEILLTGVLANGCGKAESDETSEICYELRSIFPKFEKYYPQRAVALKRWVRDDQDFNTPAPWWEQAAEVSEKGTIDEILAFVEKNPESKYQLYLTAIAKARMSGDFARARQIASDFPNGYQRSEMITQIDLDEKRMSTNPDNPASIQKALSTFQKDEERIQFLLSSAISRIGVNDRKAAIVFLNHAGQIIDSSKGRTQLEGQVVLSLMYCSMQSDRGFAIVESMIPRLNQLVSAAAALDGVENNYLRDEEWNMTGEGELGRILTTLAQNAGWFAKLDFDRSVNLAQQLERPELRLMAELKIAQGVLSDQANPIMTLQPKRTTVYRTIY
jgi:hypothetical protein